MRPVCTALFIVRVFTFTQTKKVKKLKQTRDIIYHWHVRSGQRTNIGILDKL